LFSSTVSAMASATPAASSEGLPHPSLYGRVAGLSFMNNLVEKGVSYYSAAKERSALLQAAESKLKLYSLPVYERLQQRGIIKYLEDSAQRVDEFGGQQVNKFEARVQKVSDSCSHTKQLLRDRLNTQVALQREYVAQVPSQFAQCVRNRASVVKDTAHSSLESTKRVVSSRVQAANETVQGSVKSLTNRVTGVSTKWLESAVVIAEDTVEHYLPQESGESSDIIQKDGKAHPIYRVKRLGYNVSTRVQRRVLSNMKNLQLRSKEKAASLERFRVDLIQYASKLLDSGKTRTSETIQSCSNGVNSVAEKVQSVTPQPVSNLLLSLRAKIRALTELRLKGTSVFCHDLYCKANEALNIDYYRSLVANYSVALLHNKFAMQVLDHFPMLSSYLRVRESNGDNTRLLGQQSTDTTTTSAAAIHSSLIDSNESTGAQDEFAGCEQSETSTGAQHHFAKSEQEGEAQQTNLAASEAPVLCDKEDSVFEDDSLHHDDSFVDDPDLCAVHDGDEADDTLESLPAADESLDDSSVEYTDEFHSNQKVEGTQQS